MMDSTQEQPQCNKDENNPTTIQLQAIVVVNTTVVHGEHCSNGATSSGETDASIVTDNNFASSYNLFSESTRKCDTFLSWRRLVYILAIFFTISVISGLYLCPIIFYARRDTFEFKSDENFTATPRMELKEICNISEVERSTCTKHVMFTYKALRSASKKTSLFCLNQTQELFCDALKNCSDESYDDIKDLMCQDVRQKYCTAEWRGSEGSRKKQRKQLIDCNEYGETSMLNCSDQFGLNEDGSLCLPLCNEFSQDGEKATTVYRTTTVIASLINVIGGIIVLIAAYKNRKNMFCYPQVLLVINTVLMTVLSFIISLVNITMGAWNPLCSDKLLPTAKNNPSAMCKLQAFIYFSVITMYGLFWLVYIVRLMLVLTYPLPSSRVYKLIRNKKIQYMEVTCIVLASVIPNIVLVTSSKFHITKFPPLTCGASIKITFYGCIIPIMSITFVSLIVMLFVLHKIHYHNKSRTQMARKSCYSTPEVKIFISLCYLFVSMVLIWISFTINVNTSDKFLYYIKEYTHCLAGGIRNGLDCSELRRKFEATNFKYFEVANIATYAFLNLTYLPFVLSYKAVKKSVKKFLSTTNDLD